MAKNKWINIEERYPAINEIIYYKGNLGGREGRHVGEGYVQLLNGEIDQFDEWLPKNKGFVTMKITHVDGKNKIETKGKITSDGLFITEYRFEGMTYGLLLLSFSWVLGHALPLYLILVRVIVKAQDCLHIRSGTCIYRIYKSI